MGLRFRKSIKVAPGVKLNIGKKSAGVSIGGKHGGISFNSKSGARARVSAPGTGLSYSTKIGKGSNSKSSNASAPTSNTKTSFDNSNGGCLFAALKIIGFFLLFTLLLAFGWIAGIIWLIFFRNKTAPELRQKRTIIISVLSVFSFIIFVCSILFAPPAPTSLTLIPAMDETVLEVDADYTIAIQCKPENANLSNVKYVVDNSSLASITVDSQNPSLLTLHTKMEGTVNVSAKQNDVESNILTFDIIDSEYIEDALIDNKNEIQNGDKETSNIAASTEESISSETQPHSTDENTVSESTTESASADETPENNESIPVKTDTPASNESVEGSATEPQKTVPTESSSVTPSSANTSSPDEVLVWIDDTAKRYHRKNGCGMNNAYQVTLDEAIALGKTPCGRCY